MYIATNDNVMTTTNDGAGSPERRLAENSIAEADAIAMTDHIPVTLSQNMKAATRA
jgi:hypothetical protein